jgi:hypothetical protein
MVLIFVILNAGDAYNWGCWFDVVPVSWGLGFWSGDAQFGLGIDVDFFLLDDARFAVG